MTTVREELMRHVTQSQMSSFFIDKMGVVSVKSYGAIGDGTTDDTTAINNAFAASNNVWFPIGIYKYTGSGISIAGTSDINIYCEYGTVLDASSSAADKLFSLGGSLGASSALTTSVSKGDYSLVTSLSVAKGDILLITSTDLFNATRANYYKGEMVEVDSVSGTTVTLTTSLLDGYTNTTTTVYKLNTPRVTIENLEIIRDSNHTGVEIQYARNISVRNLKISGTRRECIDITYCYGGDIFNNYCTDFYYTGSGLSYGIVVSSSQNLNIHSNQLYGGRHGMSFGGSEPCRNIVVSGNTIATKPSSTTAGFDMHGNCEYFTVVDNVIYGGCTITGVNVLFRNNTIHNSGSSYPIYLYQEISGDYLIIDGNTAYNTSIYSAVFYKPVAAGITTKLLSIKNNFLWSTGITTGNDAGISLKPAIVDITDCVVNRLEIINNYIYCAGGTTTKAIHINSNSTAYIQVDYMIINGGEYKSTVNDSTRLIVKSGSGDLVINNARLIGAGATTRILDVNGFANAHVKNSLIQNTATTGYRAEFTVSGKILLEDNVFNGMATNRGIGVLGAAESVITRNEFVSCTGTISNVATKKMTEKNISDNDNCVYWSTAAPTTGTWKQGDIVYNTAPTSTGTYIGWTCVTGSTSGGTWKTFGAVTT